MRWWTINAVLYLALGAWIACTYFFTPEGLDDVPSIRDSYCGTLVMMAQPRPAACQTGVSTEAAARPG